MKLKIFTSICAIITFSAFLSTVNGLLCFECSTKDEPGCANASMHSNDSLKFLRECNDDYKGKTPFCRKVKQTILNEERHVRIRRSCGWVEDALAKPCYNLESDFHLEVICVCQEDGCNSSPVITVSILPLFITSGIILLQLPT